MEALYGLVFITATMAVVAGIALVAIGWRGRRVGDHPFCSRCGFDLFRRPEDSHRCPECGTETTQPAAMKTGQRQLRPRPLWIGAAMLVPGLLVLAVIGLAMFYQIDLNRYKPVAWLLWQADLPAADELNRRHLAGELKTQQLQRVIESILDFQAEPDRPWLTEWGDLLERARAYREVDDEQWRLYAKQAVSLQMVVRPRVRRGDPMPVEVQYLPMRAASNSVLWVQHRMIRAYIGDVPLDGLMPEESHGGWTSQGVFGGRSGVLIKKALLADARSVQQFRDHETPELWCDVRSLCGTSQLRGVQASTCGRRNCNSPIASRSSPRISRR